ncbi:hypothetical protein BdWA1_002776 [Babesia duncani]|uniref:Ion transport domain-containing protein n=1 Tax=Babesia duncani TaxID=323732 RepID=A0AAD9PKE0_9APIC|nr:hypothetical protein BdWA1_002776 [Babesia duncani]
MKFGIGILIFLSQSLVFDYTSAKGITGTSRDILKSGNVENSVKPVIATLEPGVVDNEPDQRFFSYIKSFAESNSGKLLDDIIRIELLEPLENISPRQILKHKRLNGGFIQLGNGFYDKTWHLFNSILLAISSAIFVYIAIFDTISNYSLTTITAHVFSCLLLALTHDIMPLWLLIVLSFTVEGVACIALQFVKTQQRRQFALFSMCMVKGKLIYDLYAVIPFEFMNPAHTGLAGFIATFVFRTSNFMVIRMLYLYIVFLIAGSIFNSLPSYVTSGPEESNEAILATNTLKKMVCFTCAWPVAAIFPQVLSATTGVRNPLGPFVFFFTPTHDCFGILQVLQHD